MSDETAAGLEAPRTGEQAGGGLLPPKGDGDPTRGQRGLSTEQLAAQLSKARTAGNEGGDEKDKKKQSTTKPAAAADKQPEGSAAAAAGEGDEISGEAGAGDEGAGDAGTGNARTEALSALGLDATQRAAIEAVLKSGGEIDPEALKLTDEQVTGLQAALELPEAEAKGGDDAAGSEELDLSQVPKLTPEQGRHVGELFKTRLGKVIATERGKAEAAVTEAKARAEAAEAKAAAAAAELAQARTAGPGPASQIDSPEKLQKVAADAREIKSWAQDHIDNLADDPEGVKADLEKMGIKLPEFTPAAMRSFLRTAQKNAERTLTVEIPERQEYFKAEQQHSAYAEKRFPFLNDPKDPNYADVANILKAVPELKRLPTWKLAIGVFARGLALVKQEDAAAAGKGKPAVKLLSKSKPPKITVRPGSGGRSGTTEEKQSTEAEQKFHKTGSVDDLARSFAARRR